MDNKLILRSQASPYGDITKGSVLSHADVDNNFINLKGDIIYTATSENGLITFNKLNGNNINLEFDAEAYVRGWQLDDELGNTITIGKGVGKILLTNGSTVISGTSGVDFTNQTTFDSPFFYNEATVILADGTRRYISLNNYTGSTIGDIDNIYLDNNYLNPLGPIWTAATAEYEYYPYFIPNSSGELSYAEGYRTEAIGMLSHVEGESTTAFGDISHAEGQQTIASGSASHAEGYLTTASGNYSHAEGSGVKALGNYSHAEGEQTTASSDRTHAEGYLTTASGVNGAHAEGYATFAGGGSSHAEGQETIASGGNGSHSEGIYTTAFGDSSHAEGISTKAFGQNSHTEGDSTTASGSSSHAEGNSTKALGDYSHAEGELTTASGIRSHAEGYNTIASGDTSFVHGYNSIAGANNTIVLGANITGVTSDTTYVDRFNVKTIGSGTSLYNLGVDSNGFIVTGVTGSVNKYTTNLTFTDNETKTITHNLNTKFVHCSVWDFNTEELVTAEVIRNGSNAVNITIATGGDYDILITG